MRSIFVLCFIALVIIILIETKMKLHVTITRKDNKDEIKVRMTAFLGLFRYVVTVPFLDLISHSVLNREKKLKFFHVLANMRTGIKFSGKTLKDVKRTESITFSEVKYIYGRIFSLYRRYKKNIKYLERKVTIEKFTWETIIGFDDAALTAIASGALWTVKSNIMAILLHKYRINNFQIDVQPCYDKECIFTSINCIIMFKTGHIINTAIPIF